ncbi:MAG: TPM domain-containing protein [Dysgonamonadaceae bacterium]|jgi:uncharacterized protein|nr:TPM domain-containing protein [Dysgonamonadaceae bacterium]
MRLLWTRDFLWLFVLLFSAGISAQDIPDPMSPPRLVNDFANLFSAVEKQALEAKLLAYNDSTSTQIYVVTVGDLGGYPVADFAFKLGEKWGVGQKDKDNGAVILIKPKTSDSRGQAFIATGYGLEAYLNDAFAGRIVRDKMIPYFRENDYFGGANAAADAIIARLSGQFDADEEEDDGFEAFIIFVIVLIILFIIISSILSKYGGDQNIGGGKNNRGDRNIFFPPVSGGGWGRGGGGFGGGFGGGGGGSFGGGGAGGSW